MFNYSTVKMYDYLADDLEEDELIYELTLRGESVEPDMPLNHMKRSLRYWLKQDRRELPCYLTELTIEVEREDIEMKLAQIGTTLALRHDPRHRSRLLQIKNRILRAKATDLEIKQKLLAEVNRLLGWYFPETNPPAPIVNPSIENNNAPLETNNVETENRREQLPPRNELVQIGNPNESDTGEENANSSSFANIASNYYSRNQIQAFANTANEPSRTMRIAQYEFPPPPSHIPNAPLSQVNRPRQFQLTGVDQNQNISPINIRSITENLNRLRVSNDGNTIPQTAHGLTQQQNSQDSNLNTNDFASDLKLYIRNVIRQSISDYLSEMDQMGTPTLPSRHPTIENQQSHPETPINRESINTPIGNARVRRSFPLLNNSFPNHLNTPNLQQGNINLNYRAYNGGYLKTKIEKWQIQFSGEQGHRALTVGDFIRQVTILARANEVSDDQLLQQSYLFFTGEARKWFFTYWEKFQTWDHLIYYLRLNYEHPNQDKSIEDTIRERKQKGNERFSVYLADMERLFQSLSYRIDEQQKLQLIFENMKLSYKRRLSLTPVYSLAQLTDHCYNFDSLEPSLFAPVNQRPNTINQIDDCEYNDLELNSEEEINALFRNRKYLNEKLKLENAVKKDSPNEKSKESELNLCWNCRKHGHWYPNCPEARTVFCYVCGEPSFTVRTCPNKHRSRPEASKN